MYVCLFGSQHPILISALFYSVYFRECRLLTLVEVLPVLLVVNDFGAVEGGQAEVSDTHREATVDDAVRRTKSAVGLYR